MKRFAAVVIVPIAATCLCLGADEPPVKNVYTNQKVGVSIDVPVAAESAMPNYQVATFFLEARNGFAANVGIQRQKFPGDIQAYDKLSAQQIEKLELEMVQRQVKDGQVLYEYKGTVKNRMLHFYARAIKQGPHVFLVTATTLEKNWAQDKATLMQSVDSFKLTR